MIRGGSWDDGADLCRSAIRGSARPGHRGVQPGPARLAGVRRTGEVRCNPPFADPHGAAEKARAETRRRRGEEIAAGSCLTREHASLLPRASVSARASFLARRGGTAAGMSHLHARPPPPAASERHFQGGARKLISGPLAVKDAATWLRNPRPRTSRSSSSSSPMKSVRLRSSIHGWSAGKRWAGI